MANFSLKTFEMNLTVQIKCTKSLLRHPIHKIQYPIGRFDKLPFQLGMKTKNFRPVKKKVLIIK